MAPIQAPPLLGIFPLHLRENPVAPMHISPISGTFTLHLREDPVAPIRNISFNQDFSLSKGKSSFMFFFYMSVMVGTGISLMEV